MNGRAAGDFLGGDLLGGTQGDVGLLVAAPLQEGAGGVDEQAGFAFGHGDGAQVDAAGDVDGGARVAEGEGDVDPVLPGVDRAERGPAKVAVNTQTLPGVIGLGEQVVGGIALVILGSGDRAAEQERPVDRQGFRGVGGYVVVELLGLAARCVDGCGEVVAIHEGVGDDPLYPLWVLILGARATQGEALGLVWGSCRRGSEEIGLEWQLQRVGGSPLTHKHQLKADGSTYTLPLPPICLTALKVARQHQDQARTSAWPAKCICGETHMTVLTTRNGRPIEPRNINRAFDIRCARAGIRRITVHDTRRTCGSLLAALDVHPRIAMQILRHTRIALTMEIYTQVPNEITRAALKRLSDWLDQDEVDEGAG